MTTTVPREAFGRWNSDRMETYFGYRGGDPAKFESYDPTVAESRAYRPTLRPPTGRSCRVHNLRLPHRKGSKECKALPKETRRRKHNHGKPFLAPVKCVRCGEVWGRTV